MPDKKNPLIGAFRAPVPGAPPDKPAEETPRAPPQAVGGAASPEMRLELRRISTFYTK